MDESASHSTANQSGESENQFPHLEFTSPVKLKRQVICQIPFFWQSMYPLIIFDWNCTLFQTLRKERRGQRTLELIQQDKGIDEQIQEAAIDKSMSFENSVIGKYSIWRRDYESPNADAILKLMRDQIIMAKAYANIAKSKNATKLYVFLMQQCGENQRVIGKATSDTDLPSRYAFTFLLSICALVRHCNLCLNLLPSIFLG